MKNQANMAAAHRTPTTLAIATLRKRNSPSGISGVRTRVSMARKSAMSVAAAASSPIVCADVQPAVLPFTIA